MKKTFVEENATRIFVVSLILFGVLGVSTFAHSGWWVAIPVLEHFFMALAIAGLIAGIVDLTLHKKFAANVFEAAIGYLLPEELRGELSWIYNQEFMCEQHTHKITITRIDGTRFVKVRSEVIREFRNISPTTKEFTPSLGVNEWFRDGSPSRVLNFRHHVEGSEPSNDIAAQAVKTDDGELAVKSPPLKIKGNQKLSVCFEMEETLAESDLAYAHFGAPTTNVTVIVDAPPDLKVRVLFSRRKEGPEFTQMNDTTWRMKGVLLPMQGIRVIWYPKDKLAAWKASVN